MQIANPRTISFFTSSHFLSGLRFCFMAGISVYASLSPAAETSGSLSAADFQNPPISARPGAFWNWLNGNTDRDRIRYDLQQMKDKGMSGAEIWDVAAIKNGDMIPAGPEFLGPESAATIRFALSEAHKLGLRMGMITSSGWNAGGSWVDPTWASKMLVSSTTVTIGPAEFNQVLPFPEVPKECPLGANGKPVFYKDIAVLAVPDAADKSIQSIDSVIDLTSKLTPDGTLRWNAPAGAWRILRFVCTNTGQTMVVPSPKSDGLFIDFLEPDATRRHLQVIMDRLGITSENAADSGLNYLEVDSMELHAGNPWTDKFSDWFQKYRGYDPLRWMPVLAGWTIYDKTASDQFLYDYKHTVSDLLIHSHYETGSQFLAKYKMDFVGEAGGPGPPIWNTCPVDALKALGNVTIPRGEFWIQHRNMFLIKEVASASHIYGKPLVDAESFTTWRRWEDSPATLKVSADRAFSEGLNHITIHGFAHSPDEAGLPGRTYHAGIDINPNTTWWRYARPFMDYLARCSFMLQQGQPVADVLWYYGDQAPNFFPTFHDVPVKPRIPGLGRGYEYDVVNSDVILNRLKVENGRFVLPEGTSYKVLAFADDAAMPLEVLQKLASFVKAGGTITGKPPRSAPGFFKNEEQTRHLSELTGQLWPDATTGSVSSFGLGKAYGPARLDNVLGAEKVSPDVITDNWEKKPELDFIHRRTANEDIYFVRISSDKPEPVHARFRVTGKNPELWDPATGQSRPCRSFTPEGNYTAVDFDLEAGGAVFVVFSDHPSTPAVPTTETPHPLDPTRPWNLSFPQGLGAPTSTTLTRLASWTESDNPGIRYFSGTADYTTTITVQPEWLTSGTRLLLDLGSVKDVAEISVNGQSFGILWKPPYQIDVTDHVRPGENQLSIKVTNQWHNRRIGDALAPEKDRITRTNTTLPDTKAVNLMPSGLLGPVMLIEKRSATSLK